MHQFKEQLQSLINSSIDTNRMNGQRVFDRVIPREDIGSFRVTRQKVELVKSWGDFLNVDVAYVPDILSFQVKIDLDKVALTLAQAKRVIENNAVKKK